MKIMNPDLVLPIEVLTKNASIIDLYPLDVVQKTGKYQFIYDYQIGGFTPNTGLISNEFIAISNKYSKGDVVNVIRFDGRVAIVENPNYVATNDNKIGYFFSMLDTTKQKEFSIPKDLLNKVDDSTPVTVQTGINYGANPKPQSVNETKPFQIEPYENLNINNETVLEENASFTLAKDFQYITGYGSSETFTKDLVPKYSVLKAGTKVSGRLLRRLNKTSTINDNSALPFDYLNVKGYSEQGAIDIPIEYLTRDNQTNNGAVVPVKNNNKNLYIIAGIILVGYVLFQNNKTE